MIKILNGILNILKMIMLLVCFVLTFFIIIQMYNRLNKDLIGSISNFVPFVLLFILFCVNFVLKQKTVNNCTFYNITCCLVFSMLLFAIYRTFTDKNMVVILRLGYDINFNYFADIIAPMRVMLYCLSVSNILLMFTGLKIFEKEETVETKCKTKNSKKSVK